jgi:hypothetical protein
MTTRSPGGIEATQRGQGIAVEVQQTQPLRDMTGIFGYMICIYIYAHYITITDIYIYIYLFIYIYLKSSCLYILI